MVTAGELHNRARCHQVIYCMGFVLFSSGYCGICFFSNGYCGIYASFLLDDEQLFSTMDFLVEGLGFFKLWISKLWETLSLWIFQLRDAHFFSTVDFEIVRWALLFNCGFLNYEISFILFQKNLGWVGLAVCRPKKEDWLPKKERNQRTPGCRRSQEDFRGNWRAPWQGPVYKLLSIWHDLIHLPFSLGYRWV